MIKRGASKIDKLIEVKEIKISDKRNELNDLIANSTMAKMALLGNIQLSQNISPTISWK
jgi:hypothetical protein